MCWCWLQLQNLKRGDLLCKGQSLFGGLCLFQSKRFSFKCELRKTSFFQNGVYVSWQIHLGVTDWPESSSESYYVLKLILSKPLQSVSKFSSTSDNFYPEAFERHENLLLCLKVYKFWFCWNIFPLWCFVYRIQDFNILWVYRNLDGVFQM